MNISSSSSFLLLLLLHFLLHTMVTPSPTSLRHWLRQCFNFPGITKGLAAISQPSLLVPQIHVQHVNDIDFASLKDARGVRCIVFDKDQTLSHTYASAPHPSVASTVAATKALFPRAVAILSNSVGSCDDDGYRGAVEAERTMQLPVIRHRLKKPACLAEVLQHFEAATGRPVSPAEICMVGDRVLTDVLFANSHGMVSVLVEPLSPRHDHPIAVLLRILETRLLLPVLRWLGARPRAFEK